MIGLILRWSGVAILIAGVAVYTFAPVSPDPDATGNQVGAWMIPIAYFAMLLGAGIVTFGWFRKQH